MPDYQFLGLDSGTW